MPVTTSNSQEESMTRKLRSLSGLRLQAAAVGALSLLGGRVAQAQWGGYNQNQGSQLVFEWQGNVDRETQFDIGSRGVNVVGVNGNESRGRFLSRSTMPRGTGTLYVQRVSGRGNVDVVQQPGYNGSDGVVRIADPSGGQGYYDIRVYWQPNGTYGSNTYPNGSSYPNGSYPNTNSDRNGVYTRNGEVARDRNGVALDRNGNVIRDRRGNVVYERRGNEQLVRDRNGNVVFDRNGNPAYERVRNGRGRWDR
jgi:hypothetical protein